MLQRTSKKLCFSFNKVTFIALAISLLAMLHGPAVFACAGGDDDCFNNECMSFFAPELSIANPDSTGEDPNITPFFRTQIGYYLDYKSSPPEELLEKENAEEWKKLLAADISTETLNKLLYKADLKSIDALIFSLKGKTAQPDADLLAAMKKVKDPALALSALYYLGFAKRVEPIALSNKDETSWDDGENAEEKTKTPALHKEALLKNGLKQTESEKFPAIQKRYEFQMLRLYFYSAKYDEAIAYFEKHKNDFNESSSIKFRFLSLGAGAYYKNKKYGEANYYSSLVFDQYAPLRLSSFYSFHPQEEADWQKSLTLAKTTREKAILWQMLGIYQDAVTAIEKIYSLEPKSNLLPLLLAREVNIQEEATTSYADLSKTKDASSSYLEGTSFAIIKKIADENKAEPNYLWNLAVAHLYATHGEENLAEPYLTKAKASAPKTAPWTDQCRMTRFLGRVESLQASTSDSGKLLAPDLVWLKATPPKDFPVERAPHLFNYALVKLSQSYKAGKDFIRSLLLNDDSGNPIYSNNPQINRVIAFIKNPQKNEFDRFLVKNYPHDSNELQELQGLNFLYAGEFQKSAKTFDGVKGKFSERQLLADPFLIHINDCHDCDFSDKGAGTYTPPSFSKKIAALEKESKGTGEKAALASFQLANGLYNMSYFGNSRVMYNEAGILAISDKSPQVLNQDLAERYYKQAMTLSQDPEFQAKACFMAAKAEHNRYYDKQGWVPYSNSDLKFSAGPYFELLKAKYSKTKYYEEIIHECGYFKTYLGKK